MRGRRGGGGGGGACDHFDVGFRRQRAFHYFMYHVDYSVLC